MNERFKRVAQAFKNNNIECIYADKKEDIPDIIKGLVEKGATVSCGGSVTLLECGVTELLKSGYYNFLDRSAEGLTREDITEIYKRTFSADAFFTSANAVTENGELINVDGNGNRVAAITYGPDRVIVIVGVNKIVSDVAEGIKRVKTIAAPKNAERLNINTPCRTLGHCICVDGTFAEGCKNDARMCAFYSVTGRQRNKDRIKLILCADNLGY